MGGIEWYNVLIVFICFLILIVSGFIIFIIEKFLRFKTLKDNYKFKYIVNIILLGISILLGIIVIVFALIKLEYNNQKLFIIFITLLIISYRVYFINFYKREIYRLTVLEKVLEKRSMINTDIE